MKEYDSNFLSICYKAFNDKTPEEISEMLSKLYLASTTTFQIAFLNGISDYFYEEENIPYVEEYSYFKEVSFTTDQFPDYIDFKETSGTKLVKLVKNANPYWKRYHIIFTGKGEIYHVKR